MEDASFKRPHYLHLLTVGVSNFLLHIQVAKLFRPVEYIFMAQGQKGFTVEDAPSPA